MTTNVSKVLRACGGFLGRMTVSEVAGAAGLTNQQTCDAFKSLVLRKLVTRTVMGVYRLTPAGFAALVEPIDLRSGPQGPRAHKLPQTTLRTRIWRALRVKGKGAARELMVLAAQEGSNSLEDTRDYLAALEKAGFLTRLSRPSENRENRYLLIRNTGPKAPQWHKRRRRVLDPNDGAVYELA